MNAVLIAAKAAVGLPRPLVSGFPVQAALGFRIERGPLQIVCGGNTEEFHDTVCGACAERNALAAANSILGGLYPRHTGTKPAAKLVEAGIWMPNATAPGWPCGICRSAMWGWADEDCMVDTGCPGGTDQMLLRDLYPLGGQGREPDIWADYLALVPKPPPIDPSVYKPGEDDWRTIPTYLPGPFATITPEWAAIHFDKELPPVYAGASIDATSRLLGSAGMTAARMHLAHRRRGETDVTRVVSRVVIFRDGQHLPVLNGSTRQLLYELRAGGRPDFKVVLACDDPMKVIAEPLSWFYPKPFGPPELGY